MRNVALQLLLPTREIILRSQGFAAKPVRKVEKNVFPKQFVEQLHRWKKYLKWVIKDTKTQNKEAVAAGADISVSQGDALGPLQLVSTQYDYMNRKTTAVFKIPLSETAAKNMFKARAPVTLCQGEELGRLREGIIQYKTGNEIVVNLHGRQGLSSDGEEFYLLKSPVGGSFISVCDFIDKDLHPNIPAKKAIDCAFRKTPMPSIHHDPPVLRCQSLNECQQRAVAAALNGKRPFLCIQGPPGTGKTKVVVEIIVQAVRRKQKVLVVTPTHAALREIIGRVSDSPDNISHATIDTLQDLIRLNEEYEAVEELVLDSKVSGDENKMKRARRKVAKIRQTVLSETSVIFAVASSHLVRDLLREGWKPAFLLVDEAAQLSESATWISAAAAPRIVLAGDPKQLPAFHHGYAKEEGLDVSLMERLMADFSGANCTVVLEEQYRMSEAIMAWPSRQFYDGRLRAHPFVARHSISGVCPSLPAELDHPLVFFDTDLVKRGGRVEEEVNHSFRNRTEADLIVAFMSFLLSSGMRPSQMGVISPYFAQTHLLRYLLADLGQEITVDTVDAFQGQQRELIIFSAVRDNPQGIFGFATNPRRLNVAVTRARRQFALFGSEKMLKKNTLFSSLLTHHTTIHPSVITNLAAEISDEKAGFQSR